MNIDKQEHSLKERIAQACCIPKETLLGYSIISIVGKNEVLIENHRGILEYNNELIRISTKLGQVRLVGRELNILQYTNDEMKIEGLISEIDFL